MSDILKPCPNCGACNLGPGGKCRPCDALKQRERRARDPERATALANKPEARAYKAAWRQANKDKNRLHQARYMAKKPEARRRADAARRGRAAGGRLSHGIVERLLKLQRGKCADCKKQLNGDYHIDHIVPLARGGTNTDSNVQLLHSGCNRRKHARDPVKHYQSMGYLL